MLPVCALFTNKYIFALYKSKLCYLYDASITVPHSEIIVDCDALQMLYDAAL